MTFDEEQKVSEAEMSPAQIVEANEREIARIMEEDALIN